MNFDILEVFTRAGKITWKYKILWIFGMFASCGRGGNGGSSNSSSSSNQGEGNPFSPEMTRQLEIFFEGIGTWFDQNAWIVYAFIFFVLVLIVIQIFLTNVGIAGLARGVVHAENGIETLRFGELFSESLKYFWRLFGAGLVIFLPIFIFIILAIVIAAVSIAGSASEEMIGGSVFLFVIAFCCCLIPVGVFLNLYNVVVTRAITVEDMGVFEALSRGWQVLTKNVLGLILVGIVNFIGSSIIGIVIALPALLIAVPLMFSIMDGNITSWQPFILTGAFLFLCYGPIAWFFSGVLITYTDSVWTLVYLRVTKPKEENAPVLAEGNA